MLPGCYLCERLPAAFLLVVVSVPLLLEALPVVRVLFEVGLVRHLMAVLDLLVKCIQDVLLVLLPLPVRVHVRLWAVDPLSGVLLGRGLAASFSEEFVLAGFYLRRGVFRLLRRIRADDGVVPLPAVSVDVHVDWLVAYVIQLFNVRRRLCC